VLKNGKVNRNKKTKKQKKKVGQWERAVKKIHVYLAEKANYSRLR
jgi:hypothetical protein